MMVSKVLATIITAMVTVTARRQSEHEHAAGVFWGVVSLAGLFGHYAHDDHHDFLDHHLALLFPFPHRPALHSAAASIGTTSTRLERRERRESEDYWKKIIDVMHDYFNDDNGINNALSLHEGVLYWMDLDDIKELEARARGGDDPEATQEYKRYLEENIKLDTMLRQDYEKEHGKLEDIEEYQQALADKQTDALREIVYEYAKDVRERKLAWRDARIIEENKKKDKHRRELLREQAEEEERQKKKRQRDHEGAASAAAAVREELKTPMTFFNAKDNEPPKPTRPPPVLKAQQQTPPTPAQLPPVPGLSPRLCLVPENFKNEKGQKEDSYYEKKLFDELRQRSYMQQHPTSQYQTSTPEIKRIYDGFEYEDYVERLKKRRQEIQQRGREEEGLEECVNTTTLLQRLLSM
eukprot:6408050-Amphidinium_carterae.1